MTITKEGALASFYTVNKAPIKHLRVYFSPKQTGTGDPSPENVREIEGYNQIRVELGSENLTQFSSGTTTWYKPVNFSSNYVTYYGFIDNTLGNTNVKLAARTSGTYYSDAVRPGERGAVYIRLPISNTTSAQLKVSNASSNTIIQQRGLWPYIAENNKTINFDETMYGGYVDLVTGEVWKTWDIVDLGTCNWTHYNNNNIKFVFYTRSLRDLKISSSSNSVMCSHYKYGGAPNISTTMGDKIISDSQQLNLCNVTICDTAYSDYTVEEFKAAMSGIKCAYKLKTPILLTTLTPVELQTLIGQNNIWSNADRVEIEYDLAESNDELYRRRNLLLRSYPLIKTASNSFTTDLSAPLKSAKIYFNPVQEGTGDPSPTNIRPITGWTGLSLYHSGENLYVPNAENRGYINASGTIVVDNNNTYTDLIPVVAGQTYSFKCTTAYVNGSTNRRVHGYNNSGNWVQQIIVGTTAEKTVEDKTILIQVPSGISYIRVSFKKEDLNVSVRKENVYNVDWSNDVGTVYGGYMDLVTGEIVTEYGCFTVRSTSGLYGGPNSIYNGTAGTNRYTTIPRSSIRASSFFGNAYGDIVKGASSNIWAAPDNFIWCFTFNAYNQLHITFSNAEVGISADDSYQRRNELISSWLEEHPITIVYPLETSIHYQLSPQTLKTLHGVNNIWSNSNGPISVQYWTH